MLGILAVFASASMTIVSKPDDLRSGYYLWVATMCAFAGGSFLFFLADRHRINGCAIGARQGADRRPDEPFTPENWSAPDTAEVQRVVAGRIIKPDADST